MGCLLAIVTNPKSNILNIKQSKSARISIDLPEYLTWKRFQLDGFEKEREIDNTQSF